MSAPYLRLTRSLGKLSKVHMPASARAPGARTSMRNEARRARRMAVLSYFGARKGCIIREPLPRRAPWSVRRASTCRVSGSGCRRRLVLALEQKQMSAFGAQQQRVAPGLEAAWQRWLDPHAECAQPLDALPHVGSAEHDQRLIEGARAMERSEERR